MVCPGGTENVGAEEKEEETKRRNVMGGFHDVSGAHKSCFILDWASTLAEIYPNVTNKYTTAILA